MDLISSVYGDVNYYADLSVVISIFCQISTINGLMNHFFGDNIPFYKSIMLLYVRRTNGVSVNIFVSNFNH